MTQDTSVKPDSVMSEDDLATALAADLEDAATYADTELGPMRAAAIHYYKARLFGDEEDGRSQVVMPVVRDTIRATLPSLMKKFYGARDFVVFTATGPGGSQFAQDAQNLVKYVFNVQNPGYQVLWNAFKNALRCKTGWIKWWWDESKVVTAKQFSGVTEQQLLVWYHTQQPGDKLEIVSKQIVGYRPVAMPAPQGQPQQPGVRSPVRETGEGLQIPGDPLGLQEGGVGGSHDSYGNFQPSRGDPADAPGSQGDVVSDHGADTESAHDDYAAQGAPSIDNDVTSDGDAGADRYDEQGDGDQQYQGGGDDAAGPQHSLTPPQAAPTVMGQQPVFTYTVRIVSKKPLKRVRVQSVPPDEIIFPHDTWDLENARLIAHRRRLTRSELVAMGVDPEDLESIPSDDVDQLTNLEFLARQTIPSSVMTQAQSATWDQVRVPFYECYYRIDADGDGISELRKICRIGKTGKIVSNEIWDEVPLALLCPDPEPDVIVGLSQADYLMDLQNVQSHVWRDMLDSLKQSIFPRTAYVEGQANLDDVLNSEIGAPLRMRAPGMVQPFIIPFTGESAFPMLEQLDKVREQRTGIGQAAMALDGKALQSTTPVAAQATVTASQAQVELIARLFAFGVARMFRGVLRLLIRHQDQAMQFEVNGQPFNIDPQQFDPDMHAEPNTALGEGTETQTQIEMLDGVAKAHMQLMQQLGPNNPVCGLTEYYHVVTDLLRLGGIRDVNRYWADPSNQQQQQQEKRQLPPPQPSPQQVAAQTQLAIAKDRGNTERLKIVLNHALDQDKLVVDSHLKAAEIKSRFGAEVHENVLDAAISREQMQSDQQIAQFTAQQQAQQAPSQGA